MVEVGKRSLVKVIEDEKAAEMAEKLMKAQFTLDDFLGQIQQMKKMGPRKRN